MTFSPCLIRSFTTGGEARFVLGDPLVDRYLEFVAGRSRPNTLRAVAFDLDERGLVVRLVGAETYFTGNSAELSDLAQRVLTVVGGVLVAIPNEVRVEGHADPHGSSGPFPTDWELASGRAARVVRFFVEQGGIAPARVVAIGYGSARPITDRTDEEGRSLNRRVDLLVVSDQPEDVRALLPGLYAQLGQPATAGG